MNIYIVIPTFNRKELLRQCLVSLLQQTHSAYQIIVVDDGSKDGTREMLLSEFSKISYVGGDGNLWWTASVNRGIERAFITCKDEDAIVLFNDDIIAPPILIENLEKAAALYPNELLGSVVTDIKDPDRILEGGTRVNWLSAKTEALNKNQKLSGFSPDHYENVSYLTGRAVMLPVSILKKIGSYNESHYLQCGDVELPRRAQLAGYSLKVIYNCYVSMPAKDEGHINHIDKINLSQIKKYFFDTRSNFCIRYRFWRAIDCTTSYVGALIFFACDLFRITAHLLRRIEFR